ncbi:MAG: lysophospholipase [Firmicutes bacterium]|nr:lysophospholipase [Bacillota bacterium]
MYQLFDLEGRNFKIQGYHYPCENAEKVVVLIHGIGEHAGRYARMAEYFEKEKIAIVSMDLRGHGRTDGKRGHCAPREEVLKDIDALIEHAQKLYPGIPVVMYGHSMGGNITLDYRARGGMNDTPCGYIISAPWIRLCSPGGEILSKLLVPLAKIAPEFTITQTIGEEKLGNGEYVKPYVADPLVHPKVSFLCALGGFGTGLALEKGTNEDNGRAKKIPCLLMHGTDDMVCSIEGSRRFAKHQDPEYFQMIEWPGYYHEIHNGGPDGLTGEEVILKAIEYIKGL